MPLRGAGRGRFLTRVSDLGDPGPGAPPRGLGKFLCFLEGGEMFLLILLETLQDMEKSPQGLVRMPCPSDALLGQELHGEEEFRPRIALRKSETRCRAGVTLTSLP